MGRIDEAKKNWQYAYFLFKEIDSRYYLHITGRLLGIDEKENIPKIFSKKLKDKQLGEILKKCGEIIQSSDSNNYILNKIIDIALETTGAQRCVFLIRDEENDYLDVLYSKSIDGKDICYDEFSTTIAYDVFKSGKILSIPNAMEDKRYNINQCVIMSGIKFILCIPVIIKDQSRGVCYFDNLLSRVELKEDIIELVTSIVVLIYTFIENKMLNKKERVVKVDKEKVAILCKEYGFTRREKEILFLILKGLTKKEISNRIFISVSTVKTHLNHIYQRTKARSRKELIELFI